MRKVISCMLILSLFLTFVPFSNADTVEKGVFWNSEYSIGCSLDEEWTFLSSNDLAQINSGNSDSEVLMSADYQGVGGVLITLFIDQAGSELASLEDEIAYLDAILQSEKESYGNDWPDDMECSIGATAFLGDYHMCLSMKYKDSSDVDAYQTIVAATIDGATFVANIYSLTTDLSDVFLGRFFHRKPLMDAGTRTGDCYWNDSCSIGYTKPSSWTYYADGELQYYNFQNFGEPINNTGLEAVMIAGSQGMDESVSFQICRSTKAQISSLDEQGYFAVINDTPNDGIRDIMQSQGMTNFSTTKENVYFLDGYHWRFHNVAQANGRNWYQTIQIVQRETEFLEFRAISWDKDTTDEILDRFSSQKAVAPADQSSDSKSVESILSNWGKGLLEAVDKNIASNSGPDSKDLKTAASPQNTVSEENNATVSKEQPFSETTVPTGYYEMPEGDWEKVRLDLGNSVLDIYAFVYSQRIQRCKEFSIYMDVTMNAGTHCEDWKIWGRENGAFKEIGRVNLPGGDGETMQTVTFDKPVTFDALAVTPIIPGDYSWSMFFIIYDVWTEE